MNISEMLQNIYKARQAPREAAPTVKVSPPDPVKIVAYGGGTNSTALLVLLHETGVRPDLILFADTGGEKPHTYVHVAEVSRWCVSIGFPEITIVKKRGRVFVGETLEENCIRKSMLPSLAYGFKGCSQKYKIQPQDMLVNNWGPAKTTWASGQKVIKFIGYDADESRRAKISTSDKYEYKYPLLAIDWGRDECVEAIQRAGLPQPDKSACFFCPASKKPEILELKKRYPELLARALAMEANAELVTVKGLGRYFSWKEFLEGQPTEPYCEVDQDCGCYDGE